MKVTKEMLDQALNAWYVAREKASLEMQAWSTLIQGHGDLIASLRQNGHTWNQAEAEFKNLSSAHQAAVQTAWKHMDALCGEYQALRAKFKTQG
jgi:hypothetical protein